MAVSRKASTKARTTRSATSKAGNPRSTATKVVRKAVSLPAPPRIRPMVMAETVLVAPVPVLASPLRAVVGLDDVSRGKKGKKKLVRDTFTLPKAEHAAIAELKSRAASLGRPTKKSEMVRAGLKALRAMSDVAFLASIGAVADVPVAPPRKP